MNLSELINEIVSDWAYRVNDGMPNPQNPLHVKELEKVLSEMGLGHVKSEILEGLKEADSKQFTNPVLNKSIKYRNDKGEDKEGIVGNLLRLPKENPGRVAAEKMLPPEGSPERDGVNKDLGGEGKPKKDEKPAAGGEEKPAGGGEEEKAKAAQAMFDPKADPAMASRLDREKEANTKLAQADKEDNKAEKSKEEPNPLDAKFNPIDSKEVAKEMPEADPDTFGGGSDIPDGIATSDLQKFNTDIDKVAKQISDAKDKGEKAPNINLCDVTVAGTNLYCDDNLGIPREQMPQFKGKPQPGTPAADMPLDKNGDVDTEPLFKKMLEDEGIKMVQTEVPADKLKATHSELVADKVIGMMNTLENDPTNESLTAPIYVSRDGYVIDGHHRWAAITAYNAKNPDKQIPMKVQAIDKDIKDAIPMCNDFAEKQGVAAKKADANNETPTNEPGTRDAVPTDTEANEQIAKEKEGLSHQENQAYEFLENVSDEDKAAAIDKALNDRTLIQKAMQDTMVGNWFMKKGKMLKNTYKGLEQYYKTGKVGTTKDCSDTPAGPHANKNETIKEAPENRQDYLASLDKTGKKKEKGDDSKCKDVHVQDYQKRDEKGKPKYKTAPVYESGEKPDPADLKDGAYWGGLGTGYIGPKEPGTEYGNVGKEKAFKASEIDSKTGYFKRDGKYYDKDGEVVNEKGQKLDAQGNTTQKTERCFLCIPPGKKVPSTQEVADLEEDLTPEQKHIAHHAEHVEHERIHSMQHLALEAGLIVGGALAGPMILAKMGIGGAAGGTVAAEAGHHGAGEVAAHILKDFGKHALAETMGVRNAYGAAGAGLGASALSGGILESFWKELEGYNLLLEGGDEMDENSGKDFLEKLSRLMMEKMKTYKMTPQEKLESIRSYKFEKAQKEKEKQKKDKLKDLGSVLKEQISESKQQSIQNFVEYVTNRLKLKEQPKINLISDKQFSTELASLGGYSPELKEIFVATEGRLTADILRTIAHEMVHRKQEEMGLLKHIEVDGADGSPVENQANSIAGILMREYGKLNKQIYNESHTENKKEKTEVEKKYESIIKDAVSQLIREIKLEEAKVSPKGSTQKSVEDELVFNPDTKKQIKVKTALTYDKQHPSYKAAMQLVKKGNKKDDAPIVKGAGLYDKDYAKSRGASKPVSKGKAVDKKGEDDTPKLDLKKVEKVTNELYGSNSKGPLIQNSPTSDAALKNGYTEGEWWVVPGNAGSNFNENMSNEAACILQKYPDLTEEELAMIIFRKANGTKLGAQQSDAAIKSKNRIKVPAGLSKEEQILYKNAVITARSGRAKYNRSSEGAKACREQVGFGQTASVVGYGGTSKKDNTPEKVKTDRDNMLAEVDSAKNCYIYDDETGKVYKIEKENLKKWIKSSGGGENAADTVVLTKDKNGNLIYDGWSDKKTLADLQANGTLYNDMIQSGLRVEEMIKDGQISSADANKARKIIEEGGNEIKMIERGYSTISSNHSKYHLGLSPQEFKKMEELVATNPDTKKHYKNWSANVDKVVSGQGKSDGKSVAIAEEISGVKRKKSKEELQADAFVQDTLDKYGEDNTAGLLKNPEIEDSVKQQIRKALDAGKKGRTEYMNWFNQTWLGDKKNKQAIKSVSPFKILNNVQIKSPSVVTENERKVIDRGAVAARDSYKSSGTKLPKTLDTQGALEAMRKKAFETQRGIFEKLSKIKAKTMNGAPTTAAAALGFKDAVAALHLDKIDLPKDENDEHQILKRSTNLVMEGIRVSPKTIKDCLGVTDSKDLEKHFVVDFNTENFSKNKEGFVTGKTIAIYLIDKNKQRREISPKVFRPKQGPQAKTANTLAWSDDMQKCFDSKSNK